MGFGCWKNGCGVLVRRGEKTTRRACDARRSTTAGAVAGGAVQRRKTAPTPCSAASSDSGTVRSPATTSTAAGSPAVAGRRVSARTGTPAPSSWATTARPTRPVAPVTRTGSTRARVTTASTECTVGRVVRWRRPVAWVHSPAKVPSARARRLSVESVRFFMSALLPPPDMSHGADDEYFSDGLADEIINALTQVSGLKRNRESRAAHARRVGISPTCRHPNRGHLPSEAHRTHGAATQRAPPHHHRSQQRASVDHLMGQRRRARYSATATFCAATSWAGPSVPANSA